MEKKLILVTSPPASGKTYVSKKLAQRLKHVVYLDKDTLIPLSHVIFEVAKQEPNRSGEFFEKHIRDAEYETILALAMQALEYEDIVLINAPFSDEIRDMGYMNALKTRVKSKDARIVVIWVDTDINVCKERMIKRNSPRDTWKIANWDEYLLTCNFSVPAGLDNPDIKDDLLIFKNSNDEEFESSMLEIVDILEEN